MSDLGEILFTKLCAATQLGCERIKEALEIGQKRPDFRVVGTDGSVFVAEVKPLRRIRKNVMRSVARTRTSQSPNVATVSSAGLVTGVAVGTATVEARVSGGTGQINISVSADACAAAPITMNLGEVRTFAGHVVAHKQSSVDRAWPAWRRMGHSPLCDRPSLE